MKKLILMFVAVFAVTLGAQAQKLSKEEKEAQKIQKEAETDALLKRLFSTKNLLFVPTSYETKTGGRINIDKYQFTRVRPDFFQVSMDGMPSIDLKGGYEITSNEAVKGGYRMVISFNSGNAMYTADLVANSKTGLAVMRVKSNKDEDRTYRGSIREN